MEQPPSALRRLVVAPLMAGLLGSGVDVDLTASATLFREACMLGDEEACRR